MDQNEPSPPFITQWKKTFSMYLQQNVSTLFYSEETLMTSKKKATIRMSCTEH